MRSCAAQRPHDFFGIPRNAEIISALVERFGPQFVVRQSMGTDDIEAREILVKSLQFGGSRFFDIQNQNFRTQTSKGRPDFFSSPCTIDGREVF